MSSIKLHRDLRVHQATAWFMLQRIREGLVPNMVATGFEAPLVGEETYVNGLEKNYTNGKRPILDSTPLARLQC